MKIVKLVITNVLDANKMLLNVKNVKELIEVPYSLVAYVTMDTLIKEFPIVLLVPINVLNVNHLSIIVQNVKVTDRTSLPVLVLMDYLMME